MANLPVPLFAMFPFQFAGCFLLVVSVGLNGFSILDVPVVCSVEIFVGSFDVVLCGKDSRAFRVGSARF